MKKTITESQLRKIVKESIKKVLREADEENGEALNFYDFVDILEKNGWSYSGYQEVSNKQGQTGIRYRLYPERNASSADELIKQLQQAAVSPNGVIPSRWSNRYAPEQNGLSVVILNESKKTNKLQDLLNLCKSTSSGCFFCAFLTFQKQFL